MTRPRLPCPDAATAAYRAAARERMARVTARKREQVSTIQTEDAVTCPLCGAVFNGKRPRFAYACHRTAYCPWTDGERTAHDALVRARQIKIDSEARRRRSGCASEHDEIPALHTGHELYDQARRARPYWPKPAQHFAYPYWEDLLSEAVLALLEHRDPAVAMREFSRREPRQMLSLDAPDSDGLTLLDTLDSTGRKHGKQAFISLLG